LFTIILREPETQKEERLVADHGWNKTSMVRDQDGLKMEWKTSRDKRFEGLSIQMRAETDETNSTVRWSLKVANENETWSVWRVDCPQLSLADQGRSGAVLFPRGPGEVQENLWHREPAFEYQGKYPGRWCTMQFLAAYRETPQPSGLYMAGHGNLFRQQRQIGQNIPRFHGNADRFSLVPVAPNPDGQRFSPLFPAQTRI
jgi:hypothetical protein